MASKFVDADITAIDSASEFEGSPTGTVNPPEYEITRTFKCAWKDMGDFIRELCGYVEVVGDEAVYHAPDTYDLLDVTLYCTHCEFQPFAGKTSNADDAQVATYDYARVTAHYEIPDYDRQAGEETYVTERLRSVSEFLTLPHKGLKWLSDLANLEATEAPALVMRMIVWEYTVHKAVTLPDAVFDLASRTNNAPVKSARLNRVFGTETLLCGDPETEREVTSEGVGLWTVTFRFVYRPTGWNYWPRSDSAALFDQITLDGVNPRKPYVPADFGIIIP